MKKVFLALIVIISLVGALSQPGLARADGDSPTDTPATVTDSSSGDATPVENVSTDSGAAATVSDPTDSPTAAGSDATEVPPAGPTEISTDVTNTESPTEVPTEISTETSTDAPETQAPTDVSTDASTETPTDASTEAATSAATDAVTDAANSAATDPVAATPEPVSDVVTVLEDTGSQLVDQAGNPVPLASQQAAEVLTGSDPYYFDGSQWVGYSTSGTCPAIVNVCNTTATPLQDAITGAPTGGTVFVESGTYTEQITITKSLTLQGAGSGTTTIQAPGTLNGDANGQKSIVTISGSGVSVEMSGFTVAGPGPSNCGSINNGIFVRDDANAFIHDNVVTDIRDEPLGGCINGVGIRVGNTNFSTAGTATIQDNTITDYQKAGIVVSGAGSDADITGNTVTGIGPTALTVANGVQISNGATGTVTDNTISGNYSTGGSQATGVLILDPGGSVSVTNNTILDNNDGIAVIANAGTADASISGNLLQGNDDGVALAAYTTGGTDTATITDNQFLGNIYGLYTDNSAITVSGNAFVGNSAAGLWYDDFYSQGGVVPATNNCWGAVSGPTYAANPGGTGDAIIGNALFNPWTVDCVPASGSGAPSGVPLTTLIQVNSGDRVGLNCSLAALFTLRLPNNNEATFSCNVGGQAGLKEQLAQTLPGSLPTGEQFVWGLTTSVLNDNQPILNLPPNTHISVSFVVPPELAGRSLAILYWDTSLNQGQGGWVELQNPVLYDGRLSATVSYTGTFVLVSR